MVKLHRDKKFEPAVDKWRVEQNPIVKEIYCGAGEHAPRAERNNRTIQERIMASYHQMPRIHLPRQLVRSVGEEAAWN